MPNSHISCQAQPNINWQANTFLNNYIWQLNLEMYINILVTHQNISLTTIRVEQ